MLLTVLALLSATPAAVSAPVPMPTVAAADPAKLAVATRIVARLLPNGSYRAMMGPMMANMQQGMTQQMTGMQVRTIAKAAGVADARLATMGQGTLHDVLAIVDPAFEERVRLTQAATNSAMIDQISAMEPSMREGMAIAYANRFTAAQLADIDAFFTSPSGSAYASATYQMASDPAVVTRMQGMMRSMLAAMPAMAAKAAAATASLPAPKKIADLSAADRARLATLLGVDPGTFK